MSFYSCLGLTSFFILNYAVQAAAPANDLFANRTALTGTNLRVTASNVDATKEPDEAKHAGDPGGASVWWRWTAPLSGNVTITTANSDFDTLLAVYTGSTVATLTEVVSNDDEDAAQVTSSVSFAALAGLTYAIVVDGLLDQQIATGLIKLALSMDLPPHIDSAIGMPNGSVLVTVSATPDHTYALEISQNLVTWAELARKVNSTGNIEFLDDSVMLLQPSRFYRVRQVN